MALNGRPLTLPQVVWINKARTLNAPDHVSVDSETGERVACPTVRRNALAGRTLDEEIAPSGCMNGRLGIPCLVPARPG